MRRRHLCLMRVCECVPPKPSQGTHMRVSTIFMPQRYDEKLLQGAASFPRQYWPSQTNTPRKVKLSSPVTAALMVSNVPPFLPAFQWCRTRGRECKWRFLPEGWFFFCWRQLHNRPFQHRLTVAPSRSRTAALDWQPTQGFSNHFSGRCGRT